MSTMLQKVLSLWGPAGPAGVSHGFHADDTKPDYPTAVAGNPFVEGLYADPDTAIYDGEYWVFATTSTDYEKQTYMDAFSSPDLINWTKHHNVLTLDNVKWATKALWAPAPIARNGKYYIYFGANDIQEDEDQDGLIGGIGVAVADHPGGPYKDAIGVPLIGHYHHGAQPIDQGVFIDDKDGQAYIYYGGHGHANVAKLNNDMVSIGTFDNGTQFKEITPENYVEGSLMIKRNGIYYFMWSEGGWQGPDYSVSYAMSESPIGPFKRQDKILQQDSAVAKGSGHHGIINVPGTDIWYIVYHRRPLSESDGNHRVLAYDRMFFNANDTIVPVRMLVQDNFADGNMIAWKTYGCDWFVVEERLTASNSSTGLAMLDTNFESLSFEATVNLSKSNASDAEAGVIFRAELQDDAGSFQGYFAGVTASGDIVLTYSHALNGTDVLARNSTEILHLGHEHRLRVTGTGNSIQIFLGDSKTPKIDTQVPDGYRSSGANGVRVYKAAAKFGSISITRLGDGL